MKKLVNTLISGVFGDSFFIRRPLPPIHGRRETVTMLMMTKMMMMVAVAGMTCVLQVLVDEGKISFQKKVSFLFH